MEEADYLDQNRPLEEVLQDEPQLLKLRPIQRGSRSGLNKLHEEVVARWA